MEREHPTIHPSGEHVPVRDRLQDLPARQTLRAVGVDDESPTGTESFDDLPDLSVPAEAEILLLRSGWAGVIDLHFAPRSLGEHRGWLKTAMGHLANRTTIPTFRTNRLLVDFQVEDASGETRDRFEDFASRLAALVPADVTHVEVRVNPMDDDVMDDILEEDRPALRAL